VKRRENSVRMTGRLTSEPKLKHIRKKRAVCEIRLAVDNGRYPTTLINVSVFDAAAYACAEFLSKGIEVRVEGELAFRERTPAGGRRHEPHSIVGRVRALHPPRHESPAQVDDVSRPASVGTATSDCQLAIFGGRRGLYGDSCD
jgi:single-stranded DNA-binding protein